jgi:adenosine deaminase
VWTSSRPSFEKGQVQVTVNTDDMAMFGQDVSHEFFNLYKAGRLNEMQLDQIRENRLSD